jgi:hypothetical protein
MSIPPLQNEFGEHLATISFCSEQFIFGEHVRKMIGGSFYIYVNSEARSCQITSYCLHMK